MRSAVNEIIVELGGAAVMQNQALVMILTQLRELQGSINKLRGDIQSKNHVQDGRLGRLEEWIEDADERLVQIEVWIRGQKSDKDEVKEPVEK